MYVIYAKSKDSKMFKAFHAIRKEHVAKLCDAPFYKNIICAMATIEVLKHGHDEEVKSYEYKIREVPAYLRDREDDNALYA